MNLTLLAADVQETILFLTFADSGRGTRKVMKEGESPGPVSAVPRISRLMALAIHMQGLVDGGGVADYAELARVAQVSAATNRAF